MRGASLLGKELAIPAFEGVFRKRNAGITALLRAIVNQAVFANIEVARARAATPIVLEASRDIVLEAVHARKRALTQRHDLFENLRLTRSERLQLTVSIVNDADG